MKERETTERRWGRVEVVEIEREGINFTFACIPLEWIFITCVAVEANGAVIRPSAA